MEPQMPHQISLVLVDDQSTVRTSLRMRMALESDLLIVGEASDGAMAIEQVRVLQPDVVVMDVRMPLVDGIAAADTIHHQNPAAAIVMLSLYDDLNTRKRALAAGATAFVSKQQPVEDLLTVIRQFKRTG
jgi:DNA-binding NarL/FixJ family response regulator